MSERSPNDCLLEFVVGLPEQLRSDLMHAIVVHLDDWVSLDDPRIVDMAIALLKPARWDRRSKNTVLIVGLIDHIMDTIPDRDLKEVLFDVRSLERAQWQAARIRWLALRAGELSPTAIADLKRYSDEH